MPKGKKGFQKGDAWNGSTTGRKTKAQELGLTEKLDKILPVDNVLKVLEKQITKNDNMKAAELWLAYYYGKPKESLKLDGNLKINALKIVRASNKGDSN